MSFLVFVSESGKVKEWRWEKFDPNNHDDCLNQFGEQWERIWPTS